LVIIALQLRICRQSLPRCVPKSPEDGARYLLSFQQGRTAMSTFSSGFETPNGQAKNRDESAA